MAWRQPSEGCRTPSEGCRTPSEGWQRPSEGWPQAAEGWRQASEGRGQPKFAGINDLRCRRGCGRGQRGVFEIGFHLADVRVVLAVAIVDLGKGVGGHGLEVKLAA